MGKDISLSLEIIYQEDVSTLPLNLSETLESSSEFLLLKHLDLDNRSKTFDKYLGLLSIDNYEYESSSLLFPDFGLDIREFSNHRMGTITPTTIGIGENEIQVRVDYAELFEHCSNKLLVLERELRENDDKRIEEEQNIRNLCDSLKSEISVLNIQRLTNVGDQLAKKIQDTDKLKLSTQNLEKSISVLKENKGSVDLMDLESAAVVLILYRENIAYASSEKPSALHYHINTTKLGHLVGQYLDIDIMHPIEKGLFLKAFESLKESSKKVVLVDFFVRDNDTKVIKNYKSSNLPETHTIVLFKYADSQVIIFDPNQFKFSKFMVELLNKLSIGQLKFNIEEINLYNIEDNNSEKRDCTDIAVKIAFEILEQQESQLSKIRDRIFKMFCNDAKSNPTLKSVLKCGVSKLGLRSMHSSNSSSRALTLNNFEILSEMCKK